MPPLRRRDLTGRGVVVVGATSGVGRATAELFARHGCRLVLAARDEDELEAAAVDCRSAGALTVSVCRTDIGEAADVDHLAEHAVGELGVVDVWVQLAAVLVAGDLPATTTDDLEEIVRTNVLGAMLSSRAALTIFDRQQRGTLIDVGSLLGLTPNPLVPAYCATKFAVRGLALALQHSPRPRSIERCLVLPGPIDTPMFAQAANHTGRALRAIPPATSPWRVAATIVRCARRPRRTTTTGVTGWALLFGHRLLPGVTEWIVARFSAGLLLRGQVAPGGDHAGFRHLSPARADGGWRRSAQRARLGDSVGRWWAGR